MVGGNRYLRSKPYPRERESNPLLEVENPVSYRYMGAVVLATDREVKVMILTTRVVPRRKDLRPYLGLEGLCCCLE